MTNRNESRTQGHNDDIITEYLKQNEMMRREMKIEIENLDKLQTVNKNIKCFEESFFSAKKLNSE